MDPKNLNFVGVGWVQLTRDKVNSRDSANMLVNLRVYQNVEQHYRLSGWHFINNILFHVVGVSLRCRILAVVKMLWIIHRLDNGASTNVWTVGIFQPQYMALCTRRLSSSYSPPWEPEISHMCCSLFGLRSRVAFQVLANVSNEYVASIFGVGDGDSTFLWSFSNYLRDYGVTTQKIMVHIFTAVSPQDSDWWNVLPFVPTARIVRQDWEGVLFGVHWS
jgi:hypothetical protein